MRDQQENVNGEGLSLLHDALRLFDGLLLQGASLVAGGGCKRPRDGYKVTKYNTKWTHNKIYHQEAMNLLHAIYSDLVLDIDCLSAESLAAIYQTWPLVCFTLITLIFRHIKTAMSPKTQTPVPVDRSLS